MPMEYVIILSTYDRGWALRCFNWDKTTGNIKYSNACQRTASEIYVSIADGGDRDWVDFQRILKISNFQALSGGSIEGPVVLGMDGYEIPVLVVVSNSVRNRIEDLRTLPDKLREYIENSRSTDGATFKMAQFSRIPYYDWTSVPRQYIETEAFRRTWRDGIVLCVGVIRSTLIRFRWKHNGTEMNDHLTFRMDICDWTTAMDIENELLLLAQDIKKKLLLTLNSMIREPTPHYAIPVLFVTDPTWQTREDEFKFLYEIMRKYVDATRYHDGTRFKMQEPSLSPDNIKHMHMLPKPTILGLCNEAIGEFLNAGKIRRYVLIVVIGLGETLVNVSAWAEQPYRPIDPQRFEFVHQLETTAIANKADICSFIVSLREFIRKDVFEITGSIPVYLMVPADVQILIHGGYDLLCEEILISPDDRSDIKFKIQECEMLYLDVLIKNYEYYYPHEIPRSIFKKSAVILVFSDRNIRFFVYGLEMTDDNEPWGLLKLYKTESYELNSMDFAFGAIISNCGVGLIPLFLATDDGKPVPRSITLVQLNDVYQEIIRQVEKTNSSKIDCKLKLQGVGTMSFAGETDSESYWHHCDTIHRYFTKHAVVVDSRPSGTHLLVYRWTSWSEMDLDLPDIALVGEWKTEKSLNELVLGKLLATARGFLPAYVGPVPLFLLFPGVEASWEEGNPLSRDSIDTIIDQDNQNIQDSNNRAESTDPILDRTARNRRTAEHIHFTKLVLKEYKAIPEEELAFLEWVALNYKMRPSPNNDDITGFVNRRSGQTVFFHDSDDRKDYEGILTRIKVGNNTHEVLKQTWPAVWRRPGWRQGLKRLVMKDMLVSLDTWSNRSSKPLTGCLLQNSAFKIEDGAQLFHSTSVYIHAVHVSRAQGAAAKWNIDKANFKEALSMTEMIYSHVGDAIEANSIAAGLGAEVLQADAWPLAKIFLHALGAHNSN